jgi:hypothetical protein
VTRDPGALALAEIARELTGALWPSLSNDLRGTRVELDSLLRELRENGSGVLGDDGERLALQEELVARTHRAGWCLGVLAAARGADLLRGRRESDGLRWMIAAVASARGFELVPREEELPSLVTRAPDAWKIALLAAWSVLQAGLRPERLVRWCAEERGAFRRLVFETRTARTCARRAGSIIGWPRLTATAEELVLEWT